MIEVVNFTVSYAHVSVINSLQIIIPIASVEGLIIFVLEISIEFQSTIIPNPAEIVYLSLPSIYLDWYKRICPKHLLAPINHKELRIQEIKSI